MFRTILLTLLTLFLTPRMQAQGLFGSDSSKVDHVEPIGNDFITELGSNKFTGDLDLNFAYMHHDKKSDVGQLMVELEFTPLRRLGLMVEAPYALFFGNDKNGNPKPINGIQGIQWGAQYTFYTSEHKQKSWAINYRNNYVYKESFGDKKTYDQAYMSHNLNIVYAKNFTDDWSGSLQVGALYTAPKDSHTVTRPVFTPGGYFVSDTKTPVITPVFTVAGFYKLYEGAYAGLEVNGNLTSDDLQLMFRPQITFIPSGHTTVGFALLYPKSIDDQRIGGQFKLDVKF